MKLLASTANAMQRNAISSLVNSSVPSAYTSMNFSVLLYTGTMPTKAEMNAFTNGATQFSGSNAIYCNLNDFNTARQADYVGGIAGARPVMTLAAQNVPILAANSMNTKLVAANNDDRNCYVLSDATPTWFLVIAHAHNINQGQSVNLTTGSVVNATAVFVAVGSVGNENSNADLRLVGGKVYANSSTPNDQSRAVVINDLVLKFA